jgi:CheY-like chemotaxis protein
MNQNILVSGKSPRNYEFVKEIFADQDINIVRAPTMSLSLFLAQKNLPFLIVSDINLIDGDAESFISGLKSDLELRNIPIVFVVEDDRNTEENLQLRMLGADKVINSPTTPETMADQLKQFVVIRKNARLIDPDVSTE